MLAAYASRCSSVLRSCCAIAADPGSSLGAFNRLPVDSSFCTSSNCFCVREIDCDARLVRSRLLTRASCRGRMAICSTGVSPVSFSKLSNTGGTPVLLHYIQYRIHHLVH